MQYIKSINLCKLSYISNLYKLYNLIHLIYLIFLTNLSNVSIILNMSDPSNLSNLIVQIDLYLHIYTYTGMFKDMIGGQILLYTMDMAKVGGPLSVVKVFTQIWTSQDVPSPLPTTLL